jgi:hypothetical protein
MAHGAGDAEIPIWRARMPGDPEIDRDVKVVEEKLWEACYDQDYDRVEFLLSQVSAAPTMCVGLLRQLFRAVRGGSTGDTCA